MKTPTQLLIEKWESNITRLNVRRKKAISLENKEYYTTIIRTLEDALTDLRALLAAEQKEIEEAYREGGVRVACDILDNNKNTPTPQDYFKTTCKNESK